MNPLYLSLEWLLLLLFVICFLGVLVLRGDDRFWLPCVILWLFLFVIYITGNVFNSNRVDYQQVLINEGLVRPDNPTRGTTLALEKAREKKEAFGNSMLHLLGFQSFVSLFWMAIGYKTTGQPYYRKALLSFSFFCVLYLLLVLL